MAGAVSSTVASCCCGGSPRQLMPIQCKMRLGLTFEDLARRAEMVLAWERNDEEFAA
jgi:hypothetical protein